VRSIGLLAGVELDVDTHPTVVETVVRGARERGVLVRNLLARSLQISPPFVITPGEIRDLADTLRETLDAVAEDLR